MQQQAYDFITGIISIIWLLAPIVGPLVLLRVIVLFVRWSNNTARGQTSYYEDREAISTAQSQLERGLSNARRRFGRLFVLFALLPVVIAPDGALAQTATPPPTPSPIHNVNNPLVPIVIDDPVTIDYYEFSAPSNGFNAVYSGYDTIGIRCTTATSDTTRISYRVDSAGWIYPSGDCRTAQQTIVTADKKQVEITINGSTGLKVWVVLYNSYRISIDGRDHNAGTILSAKFYVRPNQRVYIYQWYWPGRTALSCSTLPGQTMAYYLYLAGNGYIANGMCGDAGNAANNINLVYGYSYTGNLLTPQPQTVLLTASTITPLPGVTNTPTATPLATETPTNTPTPTAITTTTLQLSNIISDTATLATNQQEIWSIDAPTAPLVLGLAMFVLVMVLLRLLKVITWQRD